MVIKTGNIVCHTGALQWGSGKVLEVSATMAMINFSDGINRKISSSFFSILQRAATESYIPAPDASPAVKVRRAPAKKK